MRSIHRGGATDLLGHAGPGHFRPGTTGFPCPGCPGQCRSGTIQFLFKGGPGHDDRYRWRASKAFMGRIPAGIEGGGSQGNVRRPANRVASHERLRPSAVCSLAQAGPQERPPEPPPLCGVAWETSPVVLRGHRGPQSPGQGRACRPGREKHHRSHLRVLS